MLRHAMPRIARGTAGALVAAAFVTHVAAAGSLCHVGAPTVSVNGTFMSDGCHHVRCSGDGCVMANPMLSTQADAEWMGQWSIDFPEKKDFVRGGLGAIAGAAFSRSPSRIEFRATLDRTDREAIEAHLPSGAPADEDLVEYGSVVLNEADSGDRPPLLSGEARFALDSACILVLDGDVAAFDAVSEPGRATSLPFRSSVSWSIRRASDSEVVASRSAVIERDGFRGDVGQPMGALTVALPAGDYVLACDLDTAGMVSDRNDDCPRASWSDLDEASVTLSVEGLVDGDLDGNGIVDFGDVGILLLETGPGCGPADLDSNGAVDSADVSLLMMLFT